MTKKKNTTPMYVTNPGDRVVNTREVAQILKISSELIPFLRKREGLPFFKYKKYILYHESEVVRWRNRWLTEHAEVVVNLPTFYVQIAMDRFCSYEKFKEKIQEKVFLDGDNAIQYIKRQNVWKDIKDVIGDISAAFYYKASKTCFMCGAPISTTLDKARCHRCRKGMF